MAYAPPLRQLHLSLGRQPLPAQPALLAFLERCHTLESVALECLLAEHVLQQALLVLALRPNLAALQLAEVVPAAVLRSMAKEVAALFRQLRRQRVETSLRGRLVLAPLVPALTDLKVEVVDSKVNVLPVIAATLTSLRLLELGLVSDEWLVSSELSLLPHLPQLEQLNMRAGLTTFTETGSGSSSTQPALFADEELRLLLAKLPLLKCLALEIPMALSSRALLMVEERCLLLTDLALHCTFDLLALARYRAPCYPRLESLHASSFDVNSTSTG